jgi:hypothetical protein
MIQSGMNNRECFQNLMAAEALKMLSGSSKEQEYWTGYMQSLNERFHGGTITHGEHTLWLVSGEKGIGYSRGINGDTVFMALQRMVEK